MFAVNMSGVVDQISLGLLSGQQTTRARANVKIKNCITKDLGFILPTNQDCLLMGV